MNLLSNMEYIQKPYYFGFFLDSMDSINPEKMIRGKTQMLIKIVRPIILEIFRFYCFLALPILFRCLSLNYINICVHQDIFLLKVAGCGDPGDIRNGIQQVEGTRWTVGTRVAYICNPGYQISGQSTIFCQSNGLWTGSAPTCIFSTQQTGEMLAIYTYIYV